MRGLVKTWLDSFTEIFSFRDDKSKGRVISLTVSLLASFYNVFITGIFYTGFLTMYDMSITDTGILTFIPYIANLLSIFSPKILSRFKKRKGVLLLAKLIYYTIYIVVATMMPMFVHDPGARLFWFIVIMAFSAGFFALFGSGFTIWFYNFYPDDTDQRIRYLSLTQIFSSILSSIILLGSSLLTDALSNSPYQNQLILIFRYIAFVLVLVEILIQSRAKEYPYVETPDIKLRDVFTLPFKYKKFIKCRGIVFFWNFIANISNGLWMYHLLNHLHFTYTLINTVAVLYTVILLILSPVWKKILRRYSWIKTFGIGLLLYTPTEFIFLCMTMESRWLYVPTMIIQYIMNVGLNLAYSNIPYMNLPKENSTAHMTFNSIGCNVFAFLGLMTGTLISSITGDSYITILGLDFYSVQFTTIIRGVSIFTLGIIMLTKWRSFTADEEIREIEHMERMRKKKV